MMPEIEVYLNADSAWVTESLAERFRVALLSLLPRLLEQPVGPDHVLSSLPLVEISIVDDETIAQVHGEFLNDPTPTDAITFPYGEILVSCDTAVTYAQSHDLSPQEELFRYMVHGLVHLHGYLDYDPADRESLFAVQEPLVREFFPR